jgi:hypothetical protein
MVQMTLIQVEVDVGDTACHQLIIYIKYNSQCGTRRPTCFDVGNVRYVIFKSARRCPNWLLRNTTPKRGRVLNH